MKRSKFTESQIIKALKENESGRSVEEISRELGINKGTFYNWRKEVPRNGSKSIEATQRVRRRES